MVDWTGLGLAAGGAQQGWDAEQQRRNQLTLQAQQIQEQQRQKNALALILSGIQGGGNSYGAAPMNQPMPQGPMTPQNAPPRPQPMQQSGPAPQPNAPPMYPGPPGPMGAPGVTSPPTAVGPPNPQTMTTAQPVMPLPQAPNFQQQLRVFANNIRRANPNADPADIGEAVMGYAKLIQTDNSQENRLLAVQMQQQNAFDRTVAQLQNRLDVVSQQQSGATSRTQMQVGSREKIAAARDAIAQSAVTGADIPPEAKVFLAQELIAGNLQGVNEALGFSRNRAAILGQVIQAAQAIQPGFNGTQASAALAQFGGQKTAAGVVGRTAGATAVGANEIGQLKPLIMQVAQKINTSQFPTVNAIENAVRAGTGNPDVVQLRSYVQTLRNAYQQIAARGGRMTDQVRRYGEELINGNMPIAQLGAAADAMANEATVVKGATAGAMQDVTGRQPAAAPTGGDDGWGVERVQ